MITYIKKIIKLVTPPILLSLIGKNEKYSLPTVSMYKGYITFEGLFEKLDDVYSNYKTPKKYHTKESLENLNKLFKEMIINIESHKPPIYNWDLVRLNILSFLVLSLNRDEIKILDIGGGLGENFLCVKFSCPNISLDYYIYDTSEIINLGKKNIKNNSILSEMKFCENFEKIKNINIVNLGSSLQYIEDYKSILFKAINLKPNLISILDTQMGPHKTFACAQVNMKNNVIARWVFNLNEIINFFEANSYKFINKSTNFYPFLHFENYNNEVKFSKNYNLIFKRKI